MTIILEKIGKEYNGIKVLEDFTAEIEWGKCYGFVGPKGSGKSTILKIFMGMEKPDSGKVSRMGDYKYPTLQSAYVSEDGSLLNLKKDSIWNVRKAHRFASKSKAINELSRFIDPARITLPAGELTDVEKRFVEIVRASFVTADFIVLDEPFKGMDEAQKEAAKEFILDMRGSRPLLITAEEDAGLEFTSKIKHLFIG